MVWMWMDSTMRTTHAVLVASTSVLAALSATSANRNDVCGAQVEMIQQVTIRQTDKLQWLFEGWDMELGDWKH